MKLFCRASKPNSSSRDADMPAELRHDRDPRDSQSIDAACPVFAKAEDGLFGKWFHAARLMYARGILQRQDGVIHVVADQIKDLSDWLANVIPRSRDFR